MLAKPLAVTSASLLYNLHILIVRIPLGKLSCWLSSHNRAARITKNQDNPIKTVGRHSFFEPQNP